MDAFRADVRRDDLEAHKKKITDGGGGFDASRGYGGKWGKKEVSDKSPDV